MDEAGVREYLSKNDESFRSLAEQHHAYELELEEFIDRTYLNPSEQLRETELKKKKLFLKDRMQLMISQYRARRTG